MALAAHEIILNVNSVSAFGLVYNTAAAVAGDIKAVVGAKDVTLSNSADILDTTAFTDASFRTKLSGLKDASMSFSSNFEVGVTSGYMEDLFNALANGEDRYFFLGFVGLTGGAGGGIKATGVIESVEITGAVDGLVEASVSVQLTGAPEFMTS
tara:strand:+ start:8897 stop:9358 length:462 start_codon:yes stop_codon:yes gene_type:complete